jgi:plasmid stabilization system protein ParE
MAYSFRLMPRAANDAQRIYHQIVQEAPLHGQEWYNRLIDALYGLETFPERCEIVKSLSRPTSIVRKLLYGRKPHTYRIYFDIVGTTVRILHIRHGARREPRRGELFG